MDDDRGMTLERARERSRGRTVPDFWVGTVAALESVLGKVRIGRIEELTHSPGKRPIVAVAYGDAEVLEPRANYNSAIGARDPAAFADRAQRTRPVLFLLGPVHGQETEGLTGLANFIAVMESGEDLLGRDQGALRALAERCRLLIVPVGNPDGMARFEPQSLAGMELCDLRFWGQGTRRDHTYWSWPQCKALHPMQGNVEFLGAYFDDLGVNPMHDDFFDPMSTEAAAALRLAKREAPDFTVSLHSHSSAPALLRPAYLPLEEQERVLQAAEILRKDLLAAGLPAGNAPKVSADSGTPAAAFNLVSALHHICGTTAATFECPHGLVGERTCVVDHRQILDIQLHLYEALLKFLLGTDG